MAKLTLYPVGNGDSTLIDFADKRLMLEDFYNRRDPDDQRDKRIDLAKELRAALEARDRNEFDVVAFSHSDDDHVGGSEDFFWLEHAEKYQGDDRPRIKELWVPACFITETGLKDSAKAISDEAKHRLRVRKGIRVFGEPDGLEDWLSDQGIDPTYCSRLITSAGQCVPGFTRAKGHAEVFVHSPFSFRMEGQDIDRNNACLVFHITFFEADQRTPVMMGADAEHEAWSSIVYKTEQKKRDERLDWDVFRISHHCSYTALGPDKGRDITKPVEPVSRLFERGGGGCVLVASSDVIPRTNTKQRPHRQAAAYYKKVARDKDGDFLVTMQTPDPANPKPIVVEISKHGPIWLKISGVATGASAVVARPSPRQGPAHGK